MKWIKSFKLFEAFQSEVKFYRFNREDLLNGEEESIYTPNERILWGDRSYNKKLIDLGFPDREKCIHFMDNNAFSESSSFKTIYGEWVYEIEVDEESILGWTFCLVINDWYYDYYKVKLDDNSIVKSVRDYVESLGDIDYNEADNLRIKYLIDRGIIGRGTLEDLKNSELWGKENVFVWTCDPVKVKKIDEPKKVIREPKSYKSQPLLTPEDFTSKEEMANFYKTNGSTLKRLKDVMSAKQLDHSEVREEALSVLKKWRDL